MAELEQFFFSRGYGRVLFLGARGSGVQVYKDATKGGQAATGQPPAHPGSKSVDPHKPLADSEERSR